MLWKAGCCRKWCACGVLLVYSQAMLLLCIPVPVPQTKRLLQFQQSWQQRQEESCSLLLTVFLFNFFLSSWRVWACLSGPALPAHKAICSHQSFGAASHMLAFLHGVSHSRISRPSSTSQVFSTWHEQVRAWLCQPMMKFGSWNTKSKFGLRSESGTQLHPLLRAKSNYSTSWNPNTAVLWVA